MDEMDTSDTQWGWFYLAECGKWHMFQVSPSLGHSRMDLDSLSVILPRDKMSISKPERNQALRKSDSLTERKIRNSSSSFPFLPPRFHNNLFRRNSVCLPCVQKAIVTESCMIAVHLSNSKFDLVDKEKGKRTAHIKHLLYTKYYVRCCT